MVKVYSSRTIQVNPPDAESIITHEQLWATLQRKIRHPEEFGNLLSASRIVKDEGGVVVRDIVLNLPGSKKQTYTEEITPYGNIWVSLSTQSRE
jgi:hypothetical protein